MAADDEDAGGTGDTSLFAIFLFSILALALIPITIWRARSGAGAGAEVVQPWNMVRLCTRPLCMDLTQFDPLSYATAFQCEFCRLMCGPSTRLGCSS